MGWHAVKFNQPTNQPTKLYQNIAKLLTHPSILKKCKILSFSSFLKSNNSNNTHELKKKYLQTI